MRTRVALTGLTVLGLLVMGGLSGCGSSGTSTSGDGGGSTSPTTPPTNGLITTNWLLKSYQATAGPAVPAAPTNPASLLFHPDSTFTGSTGCNQFSGTYTTDGRQLSLTVGPMTLAACPGPLLQAQEAAIVRLLPQVTAFRSAAETLELTAAGDRTVLSYVAGAGGLEGTSWTVTGVNNGTGGVETSALTEKLTVGFGPAGAFTAFGGCNTLAGTYATSGANGVTVTDVASTQMSCGADADALESEFAGALGKVTTYTIAGDTATLLSADGSTQVSLKQKA